MKNHGMLRRFQYAAFMLALLSGPVFAVQTKPPTTTTSWYVNIHSGETDTDVANWAYAKGYAAGQQDAGIAGAQNDFVILDFGQPWVQSGDYGTWDFDSPGRFVGSATITQAAKQFAYGFCDGSAAGGDTQSTLTIGVGTNNYGSNVSYAHGQSWAQLVSSIGTIVGNTACGLRVKIRGAVDIEPGYSTPTIAKSWVNGYASAWGGVYYLYDYGSADGCPTSGTTSSPGSCNSGWNQDDVRYVSWGATPSIPLPEIYATAGGNAKQWQQISLYSYLAYGGRLDIKGPLTQYGACLQKGGCSGIDNTSDQAWTQLWTELNNDTRTAQSLIWSTDISWK